MANSDARLAIAVVITLTVFGILAAFLMPVAVGSIVDDNVYTVQQDVGTTEEVTTNFNATLESSDGTNANYTVTYVPDGTTANTNVTVASNSSVTLNGANITLDATTVNAGNATTDFYIPPDASMSSGAQSLWGILDLVLVLATFLFAIGIALGAVDRL